MPLKIDLKGKCDYCGHHGPYVLDDRHFCLKCLKSKLEEERARQRKAKLKAKRILKDKAR